MARPISRREFARYKAQGVGTNVVSYVGFGAIRKAVIGDAARAPTPDELAKEKALTVQGMCEGAIGLSAGLFYAPQIFAKTDEVIALAKEAGARGGIYDTHQRDESSYSIGLIASTKEVLQIGREGHIPVHFSHIKALGHDVWGKSGEVIKLIEDARAVGPERHRQQLSLAGLAYRPGCGADPALGVGWRGGRHAQALRRSGADGEDQEGNGGESGPPRRAADPAAHRGEADGANISNAPPPAWSGKYLSDLAKEWKMDPLDAAIRVLRESHGHASVVSFNISEADLENFMKQPWVVTSSDGGPGHPREYATFQTKYAVYVKQKHVIDTGFLHPPFQRADRRHVQAGPARLSEARLFRRCAGV